LFIEWIYDWISNKVFADDADAMIATVSTRTCL